MAAIILGDALDFGTDTISGLVVQSESFDEAVNIAEVADEDGDFVSAALHGFKTTGTIEGVDDGQALAMGALLAVTSAPTGSYYITSKGTRLANTDFKRISVGLTAWGGITAP